MKRMRAGLCVLVLPTLLLMPAGVARASDTPQPSPSAPVIAIIGAMTVELETLEQQLTDRKEQTVRGIRFVTGGVKGRKIVLARSGMGESTPPGRPSYFWSTFSQRTSFSQGSRGASTQTSVPGIS